MLCAGGAREAAAMLRRREAARALLSLSTNNAPLQEHVAKTPARRSHCRLEAFGVREASGAFLQQQPQEPLLAVHLADP